MRRTRHKYQAVYPQKKGLVMKRTLSAIIAVVLLSLLVIGTLSSCSILMPSKFVWKDLGDSYEFAGLGESTDSEIVVPAKYKGKPVTSIGNSAFYRSLLAGFYSGVDYPTITSITLPDTITKIGDSAFAECTGLTSLEIPASVTEIGQGAFYGCSNLVSVNIPDGITTIGDGMFNGCYALASISIPDSVTSIGVSAFANCSSITEIKLPAAVTEISPNLFYGCSSLKSFTIEPQITAIGEKAFAECTSLTEMTIPGTVKILGDYVFTKTSENLVVNVNYDAEAPEEWSDKWYSGMDGKAMNTSEVYLATVVAANIVKAEEVQKKIDQKQASLDSIDAQIKSANATLTNMKKAASYNPTQSQLNAINSKQKEIQSLNQSKSPIYNAMNELKEELATIKTTAQIN